MLLTARPAWLGRWASVQRNKLCDEIFLKTPEDGWLKPQSCNQIRTPARFGQDKEKRRWVWIGYRRSLLMLCPGPDPTYYILTIYSAQWWLASSVHVLVPSSFKCRRNKPKYSGRIFQFGILFTFYILFSNANCVSSTCNNCCYHSNIHLIYISTATHLLHSTHNICVGTTNWKYPCTPVINLITEHWQGKCMKWNPSVTPETDVARYPVTVFHLHQAN